MENKTPCDTLGYSVVERLLLVVHCDRGNTIRIIGARPATSSERRSYEQGYQIQFPFRKH
jgi:uncharacterized DUF497 family protein